MKTEGYVRCRKAVERARYENPVFLECMTIRFDPYMLDAVRDIYGYDLYREVMDDIAKEDA